MLPGDSARAKAIKQRASSLWQASP